jgi:hypothetical protein
MSLPSNHKSLLSDQTIPLEADASAVEHTIRLDGDEGAAAAPRHDAPKRPVWQRYRPLPQGPDHRTVPGYTLEAVLGSGGMGAVYLGRQDRLDRAVAVKVLNSELASNPEFVARLRQEARILGAIAHPNVVACHDVIGSKNGVSLVMEYIPGQLSGKNVVQLLGPMPERYVVQVLLGIARALNYANEKGFTHRDVKPDNILFAFDARRPPDNYDELFHHPDFRVALCDFGIAAASTKISPSARHAPVMGSPLYMAPEQAVMPEEVDFRADIYALGCTAYYLLSGVPPFDGKDWNEVLDQKVERNVPPPQPPKGVHFSPELLRIVGKMGMVVPTDRYGDYATLLRDLNRLDEVFAERDRGLRTFLYAHQRQLTILCGAVLFILLCAVGGVNYYTHWLQGYAKRMEPGIMNPFRWNGERSGWQQRIDENTGRPMLIGVRGCGAITLDDVIQPGDFVHLQLGCDYGYIGIQLKTLSEPSLTIGRITLRRELEGDKYRYHIGLTSFFSDTSEGMISRVPVPAHFAEEYAQWVEFRIELYDGFYCVWCHRQLLGVGHFEPGTSPAGYCLEVGPVTCNRVMFRNILVIDKKKARQLRSW